MASGSEVGNDTLLEVLVTTRQVDEIMLKLVHIYCRLGYIKLNVCEGLPRCMYAGAREDEGCRTRPSPPGRKRTRRRYKSCSIEGSDVALYLLASMLCWSLTFLVINPWGVSHQPDISQPPQRIYSTLPNYCKRVKAGQILSCEGRSCEMK